jgi:hypothetical protein
MFLNTFIQKGLFIFLAAIVVERESQLNHVNGLLVGGCRGVIEPERFTPLNRPLD